jgi:hypothetical protein
LPTALWANCNLPHLCYTAAQYDEPSRTLSSVIHLSNRPTAGNQVQSQANAGLQLLIRPSKDGQTTYYTTTCVKNQVFIE